MSGDSAVSGELCPEARRHARAVLRVRAGALVFAAGAVALLAAGAARVAGTGTPGTLLACVAAVLVAIVLWAALGIAAGRRPVTPAVPLPPDAAPELHAMVGELAGQLRVPVPGEVRVCPECDSWLEQDAGAFGRRPRTVLVVGGPFLWWLRTGELRALLAPVVAGTAAAADPSVAGARGWIRRLDALADPAASSGRTGLLRAAPRAFARPLLELVRAHAELMERDVAAWASGRARDLDAPLRATAHEQVGLAYAGWDRLLTRLAEPAWSVGRRPDALMAGVLEALTDLASRDRLAEGFGARLAERPAYDLITVPGVVDAQISELAARFFSGRDDLVPVGWDTYPRDVVEPGWRTRAAALVRVVDAFDGAPGPASVARVLDRLRDGLPLDDYADLFALAACAAVATGKVRVEVDWLDGPVLVDAAGTRADLAGLVSCAVEDRDDKPLRDWLDGIGVRTREPVRLSRY